MSHFRGRVALIYEDAEFCSQMSAFFEQQGYWVQPCHFAADAVGPMLQTSFGELDLLVIDAQIAQTGALSILERLSKHRPDFPLGALVLPAERTLAKRIFLNIWPEAASYFDSSVTAQPGLVRDIPAHPDIADGGAADDDKDEEFDTEAEYMR